MNQDEERLLEGELVDEEVLSTSTALQTVDSALMQLPDIEVIAAAANKYKQYLAAACSVLSSLDIIDISGKPFIQHQGWKKIAGLFRLTIKVNEKNGKVDYVKHPIDTVTGTYFISVSGRIYPEGRPELAEIYEGTCIAMHDFFKQFHNGDDNKVSFVPITKVQEKAYANFLGRAVKKKTGINFSWEELEAIGYVKKAKSGGYTHKDQKDSAEGSDLRKKIAGFLNDMFPGDTEGMQSKIQSLTKFVGKDGKAFAGHTDLQKVSEKQLPYFAEKIQKEYDEMFGEQGGNYAD
jgi:hypothetical protein